MSTAAHRSEKAPREVLKIRKVGNSLGVVLPKEMLAHLRSGEGDELYVERESDGGLKLSAHDADVDRQMDAARDIMGKYRNALRELAK